MNNLDVKYRDYLLNLHPTNSTHRKMTDLSDMQLEAIYIHQVGNKLKEEGVLVSGKETILSDDETSTYLLHYLVSSFTSNEMYNFTHTSELDMNEVYQYAKRIFAAPETLHHCSVAISKHLYEQSTHPKVIAGDLCVCFFKNASVDGVGTDAIGLFKSEVKDVFLKFEAGKDAVAVRHESGVNINKLDKGCLIFNLEEGNGYKVCVIDSTTPTTRRPVRELLGDSVRIFTTVPGLFSWVESGVETGRSERACESLTAMGNSIIRRLWGQTAPSLNSSSRLRPTIKIGSSIRETSPTKRRGIHTSAPVRALMT